MNGTEQGGRPVQTGWSLQVPLPGPTFDPRAEPCARSHSVNVHMNFCGFAKSVAKS